MKFDPKLNTFTLLINQIKHILPDDIKDIEVIGREALIKSSKGMYIIKIEKIRE